MLKTNLLSLTIARRLFVVGCAAATMLTVSPLRADEHDEKAGAAHGEAHTHDPGDMAPDFGIAVLRSTAGNKTRGQLRLVSTGDRVRIMGKVNNLTPGKHGFHIHEFGDSRSKDGTAAGGHYNPSGHEHGAPGQESHAGDLGNITAGDNGVAEVDVTIKDTPLHFLFGRSFVIHAGEDDLKSQPSGDAGGRVAVGVIGVGNKDFSAKGSK